MKLRVVECVDVRTQCASKHPRKILAIRDGGNPLQAWLERLRAQLLDLCFVHEGREVITDLARLGSGSSPL